MHIKKKGNIATRNKAKDCWQRVAIKTCNAQLALNPCSRY